MWDYEKAKKSPQSSSQERLREGRPRREKDGREHLTGYRPHEQEGTRRPRESGRLENSFGDIAVGTNRKKEVTVVVSRRRTQKGPAVREDEKVLKGDSARPINLARGNFQVNSHDGKKSAVGYRQSYKKNPCAMTGQMRGMMEGREQETVWKQAPFLSQKPEKEELKLLREQEVELLRKSDPEDKEQLKEIQRRTQQLRRVLVEKEGQQRRLRLILQKAREEAMQRGEEDWQWPLRRFVPGEESELSDDGENPGQEEESDSEQPEEDEGEQLVQSEGR